jgi:hypothetical protein
LAAPTGAKPPTFSTANASTTNAAFFQAGDYTFQVEVTDSEGISTVGRVDVTVDPSLTSLVLTPTTVAAADQIPQQLTATAFDQFHMPMAAPITWSMVSGPGSVDGTGLYSPPTSGSGKAVVQASTTLNGVTLSRTSTIMLQPPPAMHSISAGPKVVKGTSTNLKVVAANPGGGSLTYLWKVVAAPSGAKLPTFGAANAAATKATFFQGGSYTFQVSVTNQKGSTTVARVSVTVVSVPKSVAMTPPTATVQRGSEQQFSVVALDQFHNEMATQAVKWSVSGLGSIDASGLFQAPSAATGSAIIKAKVVVNGFILTGRATVTVV